VRTHPLTPVDRRWLRWTAAALVAVGLIAIAGWVFGIEPLVKWGPGNSHIVVNAAVSALLAAGGFTALAAGMRKTLGLVGAVLIIFVLANLIQSFAPSTLNVYDLIWKHQWSGYVRPAGAMAPNSCVAFFLIGAVDVLLATGRTFRGIISAIAGVVGALAFLPILQYATWLIADHGAGAYENMALPTSVCLFLSALAMLKVENNPADESLPFMTAALGTIVSIAAISMQTNRGLKAANEFVTLTYRVRSEVDRFVEQVARAESSCRAFALTGDELFLRRLPVHQQEAREALDHLEPLVTNNPAQEARVASLRRLVDDKFAQNGHVISLRRTQGAAAAAGYLDTLVNVSGQPTSGLVRTADEMHAEEDRLLQERVRQQAALEHDTRMVETVGTALALLMLAWALRSTRRASAARRSADAQFRSSFEDAGVGMTLVAKDGTFLRVNRSVSEILGYSESELSKLKFQDITHPDDLEADLQHLHHLVTGSSQRYQMEKRYIRRDQQVVWAHLTVSVVRDDRGVLRHFIAQIEDITQKKRLEQELRTARDDALKVAQSKADFLANMSHEIRTPMNGVLGMAQLLSDAPLAEEYHGMAEVLRTSGESLLRVINDVLDFSKLDAGSFVIKESWFHLPTVVDSVISLFKLQAEKKGLWLRHEGQIQLAGSLLGDSGRIAQVLTNLVGNAIKFTERGGVVVTTHVSHSARGVAKIHVEVQDTGVGIPLESQAKLFQRFYQAEGPKASTAGGTGLGLAIAERLVCLMRGKIEFKSSMDTGTTFWFELPLRFRDAPAESVVPAKVAAPRPLPAARLLLVEDNPINQLVAGKILQGFGHRVEVVSDGKKAIERLGRESFDAVFMDCQMAVMDGYEATRRIRSGQTTGVNAKVPIIGLTAYALPDDRAKCLAAGMDDFITKPLRKQDLELVLHHILGDGYKEKPTMDADELNAGEPVLDPSMVRELREMPGMVGPSLWPELAARFVAEEGRNFETLDLHIQNRESRELKQHAHSLAGACASLGAQQMRSAALALERAAAASDWVSVQSCMSRLRHLRAGLNSALLAANS
jgi:PAS domain S-box-containing protein